MPADAAAAGADGPRKVLIIGSGPIVIGQAAEFDYAGTQACKAMREEGLHSILVNSNPATIMTDEGIADTVYIEPLTVEVLERIIEAERPDSLLPTLGGQTGLNLAVELAEAGILERYGVRLLGTPLESIQLAEDRQRFRSLLDEIGEPSPESEIVEEWGQAIAARDRIGLPLVIRPPTPSAARAAASPSPRRSTSGSCAAAWPLRRSRRCWSSAACSAGRRSNTR